MQNYLDEIIYLLKKIEQEEKDNIQKAAQRVAEVIKNDGIIFVFGCGHSHLPALDSFYRAGGLANVSPILDADLMLFNGAAKSGRLEKMSGIAAEVYRRYSLTNNDMLFVISASGKNAVPIEMAEIAKANGVFTVAIASSSYQAKGARLLEITDVGIDCKVPYGDAVLSVGNERMGGLSTYASMFILNSALIEGARLAQSQGAEIPVYRSGNVEGGQQYNIRLEERFFSRIKNL